jgi:hypothetical protein
MRKEESYKIKLLNAYPIGTNQLDLNWNSEGYHKLTVSFVYDKWEDMSEASIDALDLEISNEKSNIPSLTKNEIVYRGETFTTPTTAL